MQDIIKENDIERIGPVIIIYNGKRYHYIMNVEMSYLLTTQKSAENVHIDVIFIDGAYDLNAKKLEGCAAVYVAETDYKTGTCVSRLVSETMRITKEHKVKLVSEGIIAETTPLYDVYLGCEDNDSYSYRIDRKQEGGPA